MDSERKPVAYPPAVEPDDEEEDEPQSTLPEPIVDQEAKRAIREIEEEIEEEHPSKPPTPPPPHGPQPSFIDKAWDAQYKIENRLKRIGHGRYGRVIKMARKPDPEEFQKASKITGIGILIVGMVGFIIFLIMFWMENLLGIK